MSFIQKIGLVTSLLGTALVYNSIKKVNNNLIEQTQLNVIKENPFALQYLVNPSELVQLLGVKQVGCSVKYLEYPSEQVQLAAVKRDGFAIQYLKNPSKQVKAAAEMNH